MQSIYAIIQANPAYFVWAFGVVNVLWGLFAYFNKQSHDKALANLTHTLKLEADRRKTVFELKAAQYEAYVTSLDAFGRKHQVDLPSRMQPIFDKYMRDYLAASEMKDKEKEREVITWFGSQVSALMQEGLKEVLILQSESNRLKLTATDEMIETFNRLELLTKKSMDMTHDFMGRFTEIILSNNKDAINSFQLSAKEIGLAIKTEADNLLKQMRAELARI